MASNLLRVVARNVGRVPKRTKASYSPSVVDTEVMSPERREEIHPKIGQREIVGWGFNGVACYYDRYICPFPAIRWAEPTPEILKLREKEKGDWHQLTKDEKKQLYRYSFCQTYAELNAPTADWRYVLNYVLIGLGCSFILLWYIQKFVYNELPGTFSEEWRQAQLQRMITLKLGVIQQYPGPAKYFERNEKRIAAEEAAAAKKSES